MTDHLTLLDIFSSIECKISNEYKRRLILQLESMYLGWKLLIVDYLIQKMNSHSKSLLNTLAINEV
ncbi:hypothetical protein [Saccharolobus islandicus]|uniref:Putative Glycosyltransferase n=1 Tax=Saccharolobus islandicus LAL14/1 TaxID=1241935 RepID=M9U856_SACIS|nr:hypothetical protein [Sulfolobus islandicus]AGJ62273.1 Putative Glycosyltransferase [Sulfolobus islandicus LAL14/1]